MKLYSGAIVVHSCARYWPTRLAQLGAEDQREQDRADAEQAADDALRVAHDEHREQREEDDQIEWLDPFHVRLPSPGGGRRQRSRLYERIRAPTSCVQRAR